MQAKTFFLFRYLSIIFQDAPKGHRAAVIAVQLMMTPPLFLPLPLSIYTEKIVQNIMLKKINKPFVHGVCKPSNAFFLMSVKVKFSCHSVSWTSKNIRRKCVMPLGGCSPSKFCALTSGSTFGKQLRLRTSHKEEVE